MHVTQKTLRLTVVNRAKFSHSIRVLRLGFSNDCVSFTVNLPPPSEKRDSFLSEAEAIRPAYNILVTCRPHSSVTADFSLRAGIPAGKDVWPFPPTTAIMRVTLFFVHLDVLHAARPSRCSPNLLARTFVRTSRPHRERHNATIAIMNIFNDFIISPTVLWLIFLFYNLRKEQFFIIKQIFLSFARDYYLLFHSSSFRMRGENNFLLEIFFYLKILNSIIIYSSLLLFSD